MQGAYADIKSDTTFFLTATSGLFNIELLSGFGFLAEGGTARPGEMVLATRGTNFEENKFDVATDANIGLAAGPKGLIVHRGFDKKRPAWV